MKALRVMCAAAVVLAIALAMPTTALAFKALEPTTEATSNAYGLWYSGQAKCASADCHKAIADVPTVHGSMVTDISKNPGALVPGASEWPARTLTGGNPFGPSDIKLQLGDRYGFLEYTGVEGALAGLKPFDDVPIWDPVEWLIGKAAWTATSTVGGKAYSQSCSACHNLGVTRPSDKTYTLANGATMDTSTPSGVVGYSIQCEVCHGSGTNPAASSHTDGVPQVVGGTQILKAQTCGQCHVTGFAPQKNVSGGAFGNANGFTTDETLSSYLTAYADGYVPTEETFVSWVTSSSPDSKLKPKFLPNGANYSLRHSYYNEWLLNKAANGYGHVAPLNTSAESRSASGDKCAGCHSGLGFLNRIGATYSTGAKIQTDTPDVAFIKANDPGISCPVCHRGHVGYKEGGGYDSQRTWGAGSAHPGKDVECADCHNWQYEVLGQPLQSEQVGVDTYARPTANQRVRHPQREMLAGGFGGDDGTAGLWGVEASGPEMGSTKCKDCHMPRTAKEGAILPKNMVSETEPDTGDVEATRMSHRFHPVLPGDAERWHLRQNGDSCVAECHRDGGRDTWTRAEFQTWIDGVQAAVGGKTAEATAALGAIAGEYGLLDKNSNPDWTKFMAAQPASPDPASALSAAEWTMLQHAAQNADFVINDASEGVHNAAYAGAGLGKAVYWAKSFEPAFTISVDPGYRNGDGGVEVKGSLRGHDGSVVSGATVKLEASTDGGTTWAVRGSVDASATDFTVASGALVGDTTFRFVYQPAEGVSYASDTVTVTVPKTDIIVDPSQASMGWLDAASVSITLEATPKGAITFCSLSGAEVSAPAVYAAPFAITAEGATTITYWSVNAEGTEAIRTVAIKLDRSAPSVSSDAKTLYTDTATIKINGADAISPISKVEYSLDGKPWTEVAGANASVTTAVLGAHTVKARTTDSAGHVSAEKSWTFSVKTTPKLTKSPNVSGLSKRLYQTQTFAVTVKRSTGAAVSGKYVYLERSTNGRTWSRYASVKTGSTGVASKAVKFSARGYTYWRWTSPSDAIYNAISTSSTKVTVR